MPTLLEAKVARGRRIPYRERNLAATIADFYLLEALVNLKGSAEAKEALERLEETLAPEFANYLDIAVGGELRYARRQLGDRAPSELRPFFDEVSERGLERGAAWLTWGVLRRVHGVRALELAEETFRTEGWRAGFGGKAWASIASVLRAFLERRINRRVFIDATFSLQHNSGIALNKLYRIGDASLVLAAHGIDDYDALLAKASAEVRDLWSLQERRRKFLLWQEHDPAWLGAQCWVPYAEEQLWPGRRTT